MLCFTFIFFLSRIGIFLLKSALMKIGHFPRAMDGIFLVIFHGVGNILTKFYPCDSFLLVLMGFVLILLVGNPPRLSLSMQP